MEKTRSSKKPADSQPLILSVGHPYGDNDCWPEGILYNHNIGGQLFVICYESPTIEEMRAIRYEDAEFALFVRGDLIFLLARFGTIPWMDASFTIHLVSRHEWPDISEPEPDDRMLITVVLLDTDAVVRVLRVSTLSPAFTEAYKAALRAQSGLPWNRSTYERQVHELYARYTTMDLLNRCQIRTIAGF